MGRSRYRFGENAYPYFVTCTIAGWLPVFTRPTCVQFVLESLTWLQNQGRLTLFAYVVMENHLHLIASVDDPSKEIANFKSYTARCILDRLLALNDKTVLRQLKAEKSSFKTDRDHQLWTEGSHPQKIDHEEMMWQKIEYTHNNPVRRGYVDDVLHWRYSSARNYAKQVGLVPITTDWQ